MVEVDDELMELYLEQGEELAPEQLHEPLEKALRDGHLMPICFVSATTGVGVPELLDVFERLMPNPTEGNLPIFLKGDGDDAEEVTVTPNPNLHIVAHVFMVNIPCSIATFTSIWSPIDYRVPCTVWQLSQPTMLMRKKHLMHYTLWKLKIPHSNWSILPH